MCLIGREGARAFETNAFVERYTKRVQLLGFYYREVFAILVLVMILYLYVEQRYKYILVDVCQEF